MKLLILIIYSNNKEIYKEMLNIQRSYLKNYENISSYFVQMRENQQQDLEIVDDIIYIKNQELLLNIMYKTIEAMNYLINILNNEYNYIIRTNVSTILNIPKILEHCANLPADNIYTGGLILNLKWLDRPSGVVDNSFFGTNFATGTFIILSLDIAKHITQNQNNINYSIIDDVAFGLYVKKYFIEAYENINKYRIEKYYLVNKLLDDSNINSIVDNVIFRNKIPLICDKYSRNTDVNNMKKIIEMLYKII